MKFAAEQNADALCFLATLSGDQEVIGADFHHLFRVRRLDERAKIIGADGAGNWRAYGVAVSGKDRAELQATGPVEFEPENTPALKICCALTKGEKPELTVAQLTELGIDEIVLFKADRSQLSPSDKQLERLRKVCREAAMQCRRPRVPEIHFADFDSLLQDPNVAIADLGGDLKMPSGTTTVLIGPEGGWSDQERAQFGATPTWKLGSHVLRAPTAAVSAATLAVATYRGRSMTNSTL